MMSALFAKTIKQALLTFDQKNITTFTNNFKVLRQLVNELTIRDLNLDLELVNEETFNQPEKAPCTYVDILQTKDVSMSVFILQNGYTMPLHDHPMMHGILKGLSGTLRIQSYTKKPMTSDEQSYVRGVKEINVFCEPQNIVTESTECVILTPNERNYHEITALNSVGAFFDILAPPYDTDIPVFGKRKCNFYRKIEKGETNSGECVLVRTPSPNTYYCDTGEYNTPGFIFELIYQCKSSSTE